MLTSLLRHGSKGMNRARIMRSDVLFRSQVLEHDNVRCMSVITLSDLDAVHTFTKLNPKCCIYYTADWCGPCRTIKPEYKNLATKYEGTIVLGMVNVDDNPSAAAEAKISSIPTFKLFKNNENITKVSGAHTEKLRELLLALSQK